MKSGPLLILIIFIGFFSPSVILAQDSDKKDVQSLDLSEEVAKRYLAENFRF